MAEKVTTMELEVDLQCYRCYKKVKKVLCKFPREIRDQKYDEKAKTVTITVVSNCPEKIKDKICWKGGGSIKCIKIKPPPKPDPKPKPKPEPKPEPKPPSPPPCLPIGCCCMKCYHGHGGGPCHCCGALPPPCYVPFVKPVYCSWGGYKYCNVSRSDCFSEENPLACSIM